MKQLFLIATLLSVIRALFGDDGAPIVSLPLGKIKGKLDISLNGRQFFSFEGVPYARPPVGKHRFKQPEPVKPWKDVWVANTPSFKCMQYNQYTPLGEDFVVGDEDCLYLNIYTPKLDRNVVLDVVVYIHGGAFMFNYGAIQQPHYIMDKDVVYVSLNYRLGPLGFLSTENEIVSGNNGIRDQFMALQWIQDNIEFFGGNSKSVTAIGMSAGGASVQMLYVSPKSRNLFHKGISQSGCVLNPWVLMESPLEKTKKLANLLGCPSENVEKMVKCMRRKPGRQIVNAVKDFQPWEYNPFSPFGIVIDSWSSDPVLPEHPYQLLKKKQIFDAPWIISHTNSEGLYPVADWYDDEKLSQIDKRWQELIPFIADYNFTLNKNEFHTVGDKIRNFYFKNETVSKSTYMSLVKLLSDRMFLVDIETASRLQAVANTAPVYHYQFTYRGAHSKSELRSKNTTDFGAAHGDDTSYIFKTSMDVTTTENDRKMIQIMVELVTSFAKTGIPNTPIKWTPVTRGGVGPFTYLKIESPDSIKLESQDSLGNRQFWESLPLNENEKLFQNIKTEL